MYYTTINAAAETIKMLYLLQYLPLHYIATISPAISSTP